MSDWLDVASVEQLVEGERSLLETDDVRILVTRQGGEYLAVESLCNHAMFELDEAEICNQEIVCPLHGARFCLRTGNVLSPPAYENLRTFPTRVEQGIVQVFVE